MGGDKNKLVCLGDSVGTNYKMKVRSNSFTELLARRLGLEACNYSVPGATTGYQLGFLTENEEIIDSVKHAKVVLLVCGTNNVLQTGLEYMGRAGGLDVTSWRLLPKVLETLKTNPAKAVKMVAALNSREAKAEIMEGVKAYKNDMPALVGRIHELNSDAVIVAVTVYTMSDASRSPIYKVTTKSQSEVADDLNRWIKENLPDMGVLVADLASEMRAYRGKEELSNLRENDVHLSDQGHMFTYRLLYDTIISEHPELSCEESPDIVHVRKRKTREERLAGDGAAAESESSRKVREIIEKTLGRDDLEYGENRQFLEMGVTIMEIFDIAKAVERECFEGREVVDLPAYDYPASVRPKYFVDLIDGKTAESVLEHTAELPRYASAEEKQAAEAGDSPAMKVLKKHLYAYLGDDMIKLDRDTSYFATLHMNYGDWYNSMRPAEIEMNLRLDPARSPSPETATLGEIADFAERAGYTA